jgi:hypothetical protein
LAIPTSSFGSSATYGVRLFVGIEYEMTSGTPHGSEHGGQRHQAFNLGLHRDLQHRLPRSSSKKSPLPPYCNGSLSANLFSVI